MVTTDIIPVKVQKTVNSRINELDYNHITFGKLFSCTVLTLFVRTGE